MMQSITRISDQTLAIVSHYDGHHQCQILSVDENWHSVDAPVTLLKEACLQQLATMEGRIVAARRILGSSHKTPFLIAPHFGVFPVQSPTNIQCIWLFSRVYTIEPTTRHQSLIRFENGFELKVPASAKAIERQTHRLHTLLAHTSYMTSEKWLLNVHRQRATLHTRR